MWDVVRDGANSSQLPLPSNPSPVSVSKLGLIFAATSQVASKIMMA